ncbi:MAG: SurA N-terminal domain-containing protein, partial [Bacteroidaceae bacterium]|nr:SurA N-terminal domain-containing protein [Bacteroidaceae bacterium]
MAALQKIRSHGAWLIVIIGLGLFAFIAEDAFRMIETLWNGSRTQVGVVAGNSLSIQDYNEDVEMLTETYKVRKAQNGDTDPITDEQNEEIRRQVWSQFVRSTIIAEQAEKFGLFVSEEEEQEALREGRAQALQDLAPYFGSAQGMINFSALQQFINEKDQNIMQAQQAGRSDIVEDIQRVYRIWQYAERNLRKELLENKFYAFLYQAASANPVLAKFEYDANAEQAVAEVVGVPYSSVTDKEVKVSDEDLKEVYEANKKLFKQDEETRDLRVIDIHVLPSAADVESIN